MKKLFILALVALFAAFILSSCGSSDNKPDVPETEEPSTEESTALETTEGHPGLDYEFYKIFEAPKGDYREIAYNYMLAMANYKWIAGEDFSIAWKDEGDFKVNLDFKKGETYYGLPYSEQRASLEQFSQFVAEGGTFTSDTYYYEEIIGNHCSSSMGLAYQQLIDFPYAGSLKPVGERRGVIKLIDGLEQPAGETTKDWYSEDVINLNGKEKIFEAYAKMGKGDILGKFVKTSGHSRMVSHVEIYKTAAGKIIPARSLVYTIEQTNAFDKTTKDRNTTWWIEHSYTFQELLDTKFIPLTLEIFHNGEQLENAYIAFDDKNTPESILKTINGTVTSNFPISYVRATITDSDGNIVGEIYRRKFDKSYKVNLRTDYSSLNISKLEPGTYTYSLHAGIARGGTEIESFQFTIG
ncbi:MAG: hypothetical protein E7615_01885 [Ruminococcaceae bacterium]|nr:hypothetical protein [Oscillospiraceae bacterium]